MKLSYLKKLKILIIIAITIVIITVNFYKEIDSRIFLINYFFSSNKLFLWFSLFCFLATIFYYLSLFKNKEIYNLIASIFTWISLLLNLILIFIRWHESYLIDIDYGHFPISNLYEVIIFFICLQLLIHLYYENFYIMKIFYCFSLSFISVLVLFLFWYTLYYEANEIQPLVPALKSVWIYYHVPANLIAYTFFSISSIISLIFLIRNKKNIRLSNNILFNDKFLINLIYKNIMIGFLFFTVAIFLGSIWASKSWGNYWSWDPKETWSLIVWLNYASWLHLYLNRIKIIYLITWSLFSLIILSFAFLGVNIFLSGLHSYGNL